MTLSNLRSTLVLATACTTVVVTAACGAQLTPRVAEVELRPQDGATQVFTFSYNSDGLLSRVVGEVGGQAGLDTRYRYDSGAQLVSMTRETAEEEQELQFERDGGYIVRATIDAESHIAFADCVGGELELTGDGEQVFGWRDGKLEWSQVLLETDGDCNTSAGLFTADITYWAENDIAQTDDSPSSMTSESDVQSTFALAGEEVGASSKQTEFDVRYTHRDDVLLSVQQEMEVTDANGRHTTEHDLELSYNDDGALDEVDQEMRADGVDVTSQIEFTYNDDGFITRIEDRDGNRWEIRYDDGYVGGVTFSLKNAFAGGEHLGLDGKPLQDLTGGSVVDIMGNWNL